MSIIPKQLTVKQASEIYNIPENTLRAYIHRRVMPFRRCRGKIFLVTEQLEEWLRKGDVQPRLSDDDDEEKD